MTYVQVKEDIRVWWRRWDGWLGIAGMAIGCAFLGSRVQHYSEVENLTEVRASYQAILEAKDGRIERLAMQAGQATEIAARAAQSASTATDSAAKATAVSAKAVDTVSKAAASPEHEALQRWTK